MNIGFKKYFLVFASCFFLFIDALGGDQVCLDRVSKVLVHEIGPNGDIVPHGFQDWTQYQVFLNELYDGLPGDNIDVVFAGSSVTGSSFSSKRVFGDHSDYDISLASETLLERARQVGVQLRSRKTRTAPLSWTALKNLNLDRVIKKLEAIAQREVHFMIYQTKEQVIDRYGAENVIVAPKPFYIK